MSLSKNLQNQMKIQGWSLARLSKETGINKSTLHAWTVGRGTINLEYLRKVADTLKISVHQLAYGEPDPHESVSEEVLREIFSGDVRVTLHRIERRRTNQRYEDFMKKSLQCVLGIMSIALIVSCATKPPVSQFSKKDGGDVEIAAKSGDAGKLRDLLSSKDTISNADRYNIIFNAVSNECHPEVVRLAIEKNSAVFDSNLPKKNDDTFTDRLTKVGQEIGIGKQEAGWDIGLPERPGAKLIDVTAKHFCPNALMMISEKTPAEDFAIGIYKRSTTVDTRVRGATIESFLEVFEKKAYRDSETNESTENILSTVKFVSDRLKADCQKYGGESCAAQKALKETVARLQGYAKDREYAESSDGILDQACEAYGNIEYHLGLIREENEKGKISGYVNKVSLKHWGDRVYSYRKELSELSVEYKVKTKKSLNPQKQCGG